MPYAVGHVKRDPESGEVAVRTIFPVDDYVDPEMEWLCVAPNTGPRNTSTTTVEEWDDIYVPA